MSGDYALGSTIYYAFTTRAFATGVPTALAGSPTLEIYENDSTTPIVEGASKLVLTQNLNSINGFNLATITATGGNGFETGKTYHIIIKTGTVGGVSVVGEVVGRFTLDTVSAAVWDLPVSGHTISDTFGKLWDNVNAALNYLDDFTTGAVGVSIASVNFAQGFLDLAQAVWDADATAHQTQGTFGQAIGDPVADAHTIYGAVVTDATGVTVGTDTATLLSLVGTPANLGGGATLAFNLSDIEAQTDDIGIAGAGLTNINLPDQTMNITGDITGNLSGTVGSVTGAVGSVAGLTAADVGAIKLQTDQLAFTVANQVDCNVESVNTVTVTGTGAPGSEWGP